ncbi:hypothetical protein QCA50_006828 [Cerrena zonata]|uniref:RING-type domain-containing protein n=1 Tax=Cerrena zonata TaxID=2478898 RepID=A0AAW0GJV7_9APHY
MDNLSLLEQIHARRRNRATRPNRADDGAESDGSMPSLQTVSDSSEAENFASDGESDEESDDDDLPPLASVNDTAPPRRNMPSLPVQDQEESDSEYEGLESRPFTPFPPIYTTPLPRGDTRAAHGLPNSMRPQHMSRRVLEIIESVRRLNPTTEQLPLPSHTHNQPDPVRAEIIMAALEVIPNNLITRYEKLRGGVSHEFEGCPICQEDFVTEGETGELDETVAYLAELPNNQYRPQAILAFPCPGMHLYHDSCISPWLSRKTTCPSCRFDIDPKSLTLSCVRILRPKKWEPPKNAGFLLWLRRAEAKQGGAQRKPSLADHPPLARYGDSLAASVEYDDRDAFDEDDDAWTTDDEDDPPVLNPMLDEGMWDLMGGLALGDRAELRMANLPDSMELLRAFFPDHLDGQDVDENEVPSSDDEAPPPLIPVPSSNSNSRPQVPSLTPPMVIPAIFPAPDEDHDDMPGLTSPISNNSIYEAPERRVSRNDVESDEEEYEDSEEDLPPLASSNNVPPWRRFPRPHHPSDTDDFVGAGAMATLFDMFGSRFVPQNQNQGYSMGGGPARTAEEDDSDSDDLPPLD